MPTPTYDLIASSVLTSSASSVTFSSISGSYRDLVLAVDFTNALSSNAQLYCEINGDTGTNYPNVRALGYGSGTESGVRTTDTFFNFGNGIAANNGERLQVLASFLDYSVTDKHKTVLSRGNQATDGGALMIAGRWASTSAITSLYLYPSAGEFSSTSSFQLYGIVG